MLFRFLEAKHRRADEARLLATSALFDAGIGTCPAKILEEEVFALHDAAGEGEDVGREVILVHLDPFGEHLDPILIDAKGKGVFVLDEFEKVAGGLDVEAIHVAEATDARAGDHVLEFVDFVMIGGHGVADFIGGVDELTVDAKGAADAGGNGDEI